MKEVTIDGEVYVKKTDQSNTGYSMVRTYSAGVFIGKLVERNGKEGKMEDVRRIWYWDGAASLSELAVKGTSKPDQCKFPCVEASKELTEIIEVSPLTETAKKSLYSVKEWTSH